MILTALRLGHNQFWYLASPYTDCPLGQERAYEVARDASLHLQALSIANYSPIVAGHYAACSARIPADDWQFWHLADAPYVDRAHGLIVLRMKGWRQSRGVGHEIADFRRRKKPIVELLPSIILGRKHAGERDTGDSEQYRAGLTAARARRQGDQSGDDGDAIERLLGRPRIVRSACYPGGGA